jgi:hypothetical protein
MATWHTCDILKIGPGDDSNIWISLKDRAPQPAFPNMTSYSPVDAIEREVLPTALAAISTGLPVNVLLSSLTHDTRSIQAFYLSKNS